MIFDTHAHYEDVQFDIDRAELLGKLEQAGIGMVADAASDLKSIEQVLNLAHQYDFLYAVIGIHPSETQELDETKFSWIEEKSIAAKVVAIGEIGLDYHYPEPSRNIQKEWFARQMELARRRKLPIVVHSRDAARDTLDMMQTTHAENIGGDIHCFSYGKEIAREYLNMGFYLGIGGVLTFKNAHKLKEVVEYAPIDRILLETDAPYLAPEPVRGSRNTSMNLPYVVKAIAQIKQMEYDEIIEITQQNAKKMYHLE